ncbi:MULTISPECIES: hypothetical protein [Bradyrhizobium]|uniref:hypothetical protein n=1 Tax=Bradyrhizobium TaxID=374 RepID=UPI0012F4F113|nr:hypothetical protein [Bradyrhizobium sp. CCBAU 15544]
MRNTISDDPTWFNANPRRRHRVRPISFAELLQGVSNDAPSDCVRLAAVRRVTPLKLMVLYTIDCMSIEHAALLELGAFEVFEPALSLIPPDLERQLRADAEDSWS